MKFILIVTILAFSACNPLVIKTEFPFTVIAKGSKGCWYEDANGRNVYSKMEPGDDCNIGDQINIKPGVLFE